MKKLSEKSFRILKVFVLLVVLTACGLYYVLFVDGEMPKTMETTSLVASKIIHETTTIHSSQEVKVNVDEEEFIIEIEPIVDYEASASDITFLQKSDNKKEEKLSVEVDGKININVASSEELQTLKNIGPVVASNIITYREEYGDFSDIEDIKNVKGIGDAKFNAIKDFIYVK